MKTTLNKIRAHSPCKEGWGQLLKHLEKTKADDEPLLITTILDSNGLDDALWCMRAVDGRDKEIRLYAVWCIRQVQHLVQDPRSLAALDVAERFANSEATEEELAEARDAARDAAWDAAGNATRGAAWAAGSAAGGAAWAAAWAAVGAVGAAAWAAKDAAWGKAREAAREIQADYLRVVCAEIEMRGEA